MGLLKPFRGLRPPRELAQTVACPPYDVVSTEEARADAAGNPRSFFHVSRPEIALAPGVDEHADEVYAEGLAALSRFRRNGWLVLDETPSFYVYRQKMGTHVQSGLVAAASVDGYDRGAIKKHELTRADKEDDRTRHIEALEAHDEPVFLTYRARPIIDALIDEAVRAEPPEVDFVASDGVTHSLWVVRGELNARIEAAFSQVPTLYIADGHHRSAAASRVRARRLAAGMPPGEQDLFLAVVFPHSQMQILSYNRLVRDLHGHSPAAFGERLRENFDVSVGSAREPAQVHQFGMYLDQQWYRLTARPGSFESSPTGQLDVSILQKNVLEPLLGIGDPRTDERLAFVGGIRGTAELERRIHSGEHRVAFSLHPTSLEQLMAIADANEIMPPKSTWFEPKLRSGLVLHPFA